MTSVAVVAHTGKTLGGGLAELRRTLAAEGIDDPMWFEVPKSRKAPKRAQAAMRAGADLVIVWGGDGVVQRCIDALAGSPTTVAIVPAGTANLLATNLGIPRDIGEAVRIALHGSRRKLDVGRFNGERFSVMAGAGWDAMMIRDADGVLKDRLGRLAYVWTGVRHLREARFHARIKVDGEPWFEGDASCVLVGNVRNVFGSIAMFAGARSDDGRLELGVITAKGWLQWTRALARTAVGHAADSPFVSTTTARTIRVRLDRKVRYELDGGDRGTTDRIRVAVEPGAITICVPEEAGPR
jgi:YegS/Rv2252/BmrU family lipid kinase